MVGHVLHCFWIFCNQSLSYEKATGSVGIYEVTTQIMYVAECMYVYILYYYLKNVINYNLRLIWYKKHHFNWMKSFVLSFETKLNKYTA